MNVVTVRSVNVLCFLAYFLLGFLPESQAEDFLVTVNEGRMEVLADGHSLQNVLNSISQETGILVFVEPSLLSDPLSVRFQGYGIEQGLKRILRDHSYAMVFLPSLDGAGNHRVKAVRVYPKGQSHPSGYVMLNPSDLDGSERGNSAPLSSEQVDAMLRENQEISLSHVAQQISERRNKKEVGSTPGEQSIVSKRIERIEKVRQFKELKAETMTRRQTYERTRNSGYYFRNAAKAQSDVEHKRQEALKSRVIRDSNY